MGTQINIFKCRECSLIYSCKGNVKFENDEETKGREYREESQNSPLFTPKKKYLWVTFLNLEMNNKETELISTKKGSQIIPVEQIELECKC